MKKKLFEYLELVKFEHTIFALPFALTGMLLASGNGFPSIDTFIFVIMAMVGGRTAAMALNRLIDAEIDQKNPRTQDRAIPAGRIKKLSALWLSIASLGIMIGAVWQLPLICKQLLPLAVIILIGYSYTKRFTNFSHLVLGSALGAAATGGWLAVSGELSIPSVLWGIAIIFWVGGFDIIYALQDVEFDRSNKLFSIPSKFGIKKALVISKIFHALTIIFLVVLGLLIFADKFYWSAVIFTLLMLVYEHLLIKEDDLSNLNKAFFNVNGYISIGFMLLVIAGKFI